LKYENKEIKSSQENFYRMMLMAVPTFNFKDEKDMDERIIFGHQLKEGLMSSDFYFPEHDMIIELDGPCHFFQDRNSIIEGSQ